MCQDNLFLAGIPKFLWGYTVHLDFKMKLLPARFINFSFIHWIFNICPNEKKKGVAMVMTAATVEPCTNVCAFMEHAICVAMCIRLFGV